VCWEVRIGRDASLCMLVVFWLSFHLPSLTFGPGSWLTYEPYLLVPVPSALRLGSAMRNPCRRPQGIYFSWYIMRGPKVTLLTEAIEAAVPLCFLLDWRIWEGKRVASVPNPTGLLCCPWKGTYPFKANFAMWLSLLGSNYSFLLAGPSLLDLGRSCTTRSTFLQYPLWFSYTQTSVNSLL
jgi:hypothetical protein